MRLPLNNLPKLESVSALLYVHVLDRGSATRADTCTTTTRRAGVTPSTLTNNIARTRVVTTRTNDSGDRLHTNLQMTTSTTGHTDSQTTTQILLVKDPTKVHLVHTGLTGHPAPIVDMARVKAMHPAAGRIRTAAPIC